MAFIKADKLGRIVQILPSSPKEELNKEAVAETLNFFRGQQLSSSLRNCLNYLKTATLAAKGSREAQLRIQEIRYAWNHEEA